MNEWFLLRWMCCKIEDRQQQRRLRIFFVSFLCGRFAAVRGFAVFVERQPASGQKEVEAIVWIALSTSDPLIQRRKVQQRFSWVTNVMSCILDRIFLRLLRCFLQQATRDRIPVPHTAYYPDQNNQSSSQPSTINKHNKQTNQLHKREKREAICHS
jgi:hypothetical protein